MMTTYEMCLFLINKGKYEKEDMTRKLDIFLLGNRITEEQYTELVGIMNRKEVRE